MRKSNALNVTRKIAWWACADLGRVGGDILQANYDLGVVSGRGCPRIKKLVPGFMPEKAAAVL